MAATSGGTYQFKVGEFDCVAVSDGFFTYAPPAFPSPPEMLFVNAPPDRLARALAAHGLGAEAWKAWTTAYTCLLVTTGSSRVLIDTGAGALSPTTGKLLESLSSLGIDADQIDLIVLTHGHPDHLGGNTDAEGTVVFPNARWVIAKAEWEFWMEGQAEAALPEPSRDMLVGCARRNLQPIKERLTLVAGEEEIQPGIRVAPGSGHTPGHMTVWVTSSGERLVCVSDLALHPLHLEEPGWVAGVDMLPDRVVAERRALLAAAAAEDCRIMAFHFPFPGLGRVSKQGSGWRWEAVG